jgi:transcriptional regulator GlxA family with amidase domain
MPSPIFAPDAAPLSLDLLVLDDVSLMCLAAAIEPLRAANRVAGQPVYDWRLLSLTGAAITTSSGVTVQADGAFAPAEVRDALFVVASFNVTRQAGQDLFAKIRRLDRRHVPLGGVEAGSWVLGFAGVLDGHKATTHWEDLKDFEARFPKVTVKADRFVIDGRYCTSGGAAPTLDLMLELIRQRQGLALSLEVASIFIYEQSRASHDPQPRLSLGLLKEQDARVTRCLRIMAERTEEPLSIAALARQAGLSTRMLERLFIRELGQTPRSFYLEMRLSSARRLVTDTRKSITEIAILTGFGSSSAFSRAFKARFDETPRRARSGAARGVRKSAG